MSDGSPTLGPKIARPTQGAPRNAPGVDMSGGAPNGLRGIVVLPWRLQKPNATRTVINVVAGQNVSGQISIPFDTEFKEIL